MKKNLKEQKPLIPQQKVILALKKVTPGYRPDCSSWARDIVISSLNSTPIDKGERIVSSGSLVFHLRRTNDGMILNPKKTFYSITCEDCKNQYGLADVKVIECNFTE